MGQKPDTTPVSLLMLFYFIIAITLWSAGITPFDTR